MTDGVAYERSTTGYKRQSLWVPQDSFALAYEDRRVVPEVCNCRNGSMNHGK
jgi:hypothetical protein